MHHFQYESLSNDPVHGYIPFTSSAKLPKGEVAEQQIVDHPWVQRLRQIHQLQTAWWVFPSAEHTRFQHVLGSMHLASRAVAKLYPSLCKTCNDVPSRGYVESLMRMAALLHDVGHGPFGHFFDEHFLAHFNLNHETLGSRIIEDQLGDLLCRIRRNPNSRLENSESLDPKQITYLITRPKTDESDNRPKWLSFLRSLFSGLYTVDNMDFVLRDAYMSGYSTQAFDLDRLLRYSFFTSSGLTIHERGLSTLVRFIAVRAELFRTIYFHRTVRAIGLAMQELFAQSIAYILSGNPLENLDEYQRLTEWSLLVRTIDWKHSDDQALRQLGNKWQNLIDRRIRWKMICEREFFFTPDRPEPSSIFSSSETFEAALRKNLSPELKKLPIRVDTARNVHKPGAHVPSAGQNYLFDPSKNRTLSLDDRELFQRIPVSSRTCRIYAENTKHSDELVAAMDKLMGQGNVDSETNM